MWPSHLPNYCSPCGKQMVICMGYSSTLLTYLTPQVHVSISLIHCLSADDDDVTVSKHHGNYANQPDMWPCCHGNNEGRKPLSDMLCKSCVNLDAHQNKTQEWADVNINHSRSGWGKPPIRLYTICVCLKKSATWLNFHKHFWTRRFSETGKKLQCDRKISSLEGW